MKLDFVKYIPVNGEKHSAIAEVRVDERFIFRYKVGPGKNGNGLYIYRAGYKIGVSNDGKDKYAEAFQLDRRSEDTEIQEFIRNNVNQCIEGNSKPAVVTQTCNSEFNDPF